MFLLGPSHHVYLNGIALSKFAAYGTPLGDIPLDLESELRTRAFGRPGTALVVTIGGYNELLVNNIAGAQTKPQLPCCADMQQSPSSDAPASSRT